MRYILVQVLKEIGMKIGFIGSGKMATAIMKSIIRGGMCKPEEIIASDVIPDALLSVSIFGVKTTKNNADVIKNADVIVLSVKPQDMTIAVNEIAPFASGKLIVSIAAGIPISLLEKILPMSRIIRVMPNVALTVGEGMSVVARKNSATEADLEKVIEIFSLGGKAVKVDEESIDAVTAVSGSGPAYFFRMVEGMSEAGSQLGLDKKLAAKLAAQACIGAGKMVIESGKEPTELVSMVASKGGTTEAAMTVFDKGNFDSMILDAVSAAERRAKELSKK